MSVTLTAVTTAPRAPRRRMGSPVQRSWVRTVIAVVLLGVMLFPVYWMINASLQASGNTLDATLLPLHPSFEGYQRAISEQSGNLLTSMEIALGTVILTLLVATPASYALAQFRFGWVPVALLAILISQMIPNIVIANALYTAYEKVGLLNSILGLVVANSSAAIPFAILIMRAFMVGIPSALVEAARVDGAGPLRAFVAVIVPISRNSMITAALFTFLFAWSDFLFALTLTTTDAVRPVTLGIYQYLGTNVTAWNAVMATAVMSALPAIVLLIVAQKYIAAGALGGAIK